MTQKVIKVGSSAAVTIPKSIREAMGVSVGDRVEIGFNKKTKQLTISPRGTEIDSEIIEWTDSFIERYREDLEALADK